MQVKSGDMIAGKYRVERVLGEGGMGFVVQAMHVQLEERVAIKFLLPQALAHEEAVARFAREARASVKIKSEHVARVSDVGTLDNGAPYMVMEFLEGQDLAAVVRGSGALTISTAVEYILQALEAIAEAHANGIVHRDLKPANLFLIRRADGSPCVKVLDFGISKMTSPGDSGSDLGMTRTHAIMGSPLYMSPEQLSSTRDVNAQADIWSIGTILYEFVTGRVPFQADTMPQLCGMILQDPVTSPKVHRADLPAGLEAVILRCLEKDRSQRFQNVAELAMALSPYAPRAAARSAERVARVLSVAGLPSTPIAPSLPSLPPTAPPISSVTQDAFGKTLTKKTGPALWVATSVLLLGSGAGLALWLRPASNVLPDARSTSAAPSPSEPGTTPAATGLVPEAPQLGNASTPNPSGSDDLVSSVPSAMDAPPQPDVTATVSKVVARAQTSPTRQKRSRNPIPSSAHTVARPADVVIPSAPTKIPDPKGSRLDPLQGRH